MNPGTSEFHASIEAFRQLVKELQGLPRQVQHRHLVPQVSVLLQQGYPMQYVVDVLAEGGVHYRPASLHQAVYRWRRKVPRATSPQINPGISGSPARGASRPAPTVSLNLEVPQGNAVDPVGFRQRLRDVRNEHVDLDEIKRKARASQARQDSVE